jgi:hypothetical protein
LERKINENSSCYHVLSSFVISHSGPPFLLKAVLKTLLRWLPEPLSLKHSPVLVIQRSSQEMPRCGPGTILAESLNSVPIPESVSAKYYFHLTA